MTDLIVRSAVAEDEGFLRAMLYEAAYWRREEPRPPEEEALSSPSVSAYIEGWGREGDRGVVAAVGREPLGAAWRRSFSERTRGYGFVDAHTPELTLAVVPSHRGMGVGRAILAALLLQARLDGVTRLSLSVEQDNPAKNLYAALGFQTVETVGNAHTMVAALRRAPEHGSA